MILTQLVESVEGGALLSDARYPTTPLLSVDVKFNVTLLDVVVVVALSILRVHVGASSSGKDALITLLGVPSPLLLYAITLYQYFPLSVTLSSS